MSKHIMHIDQAALVMGAAGVEEVKSIVANFIQGFCYGENIPMYVSRKIDGTPAIVFGIDGGGFFISTKAFFNKIPIKNYSIADINTNHSGELAEKLQVVFEHLSHWWTVEGIFQADLLFWPGQPQQHIIDKGIPSIRYKPNVVQYDHIFGGRTFHPVSVATIGLAMHSCIDPHTSETFLLSGRPESPSDVFFLDVSVNSGWNDSDEYIEFLESKLKELDGLDSELLDEHQDIRELMVKYDNYCVKWDITFECSEDYRIGFDQWLWLQTKKKTESLKSIPAKHKHIDRYFEIGKRGTREMFAEHLKFIKLVKKIKSHMIAMFSMKSNVFIQEQIGDEYVGEGFVVQLDTGSDMGILVKLVQREIFTKANMNANKGWLEK